MDSCLWVNDEMMAHPLTPTLSPRERERKVEGAVIKK
jgi:hypothetical protein